MLDSQGLTLAIIITTFVIVGLVVASSLLLMVNANRRIRHLAELADEVRKAEREAVQHTLSGLSYELHDNVNQLIAIVKMGLQNALADASDTRSLLAAREALGQCEDEIRRLSHSLNSDMWTRTGFAEAIAAEAERLERVARIRTHLVFEGEWPAMESDTSTLLYRVFQELVNNVLKHSGADALTITLQGSPAVALTIHDNGRGFDPAAVRKSVGLLTIQRRCALIGFRATCVSAPGEGCTWTIAQEAGTGVGMQRQGGGGALMGVRSVQA